MTFRMGMFEGRHYLCRSQTRRRMLSLVVSEGVYKFCVRTFTQLARILSNSRQDKQPSTTRTATTIVHKSRPTITDADYERLMSQFKDEESGMYSLRSMIAQLKECGLRSTDGRLAAMFQGIKAELKEDPEVADLKVDRVTMQRLVLPCYSIVHKALRKELIIPDFVQFSKEVEEIYNLCLENQGGEVSDFTPQLAEANPDTWAVSVCTVNGQRTVFGPVDLPFTIQSCSKPFMYGLALEKLGRNEVHRYVGKEPSGRGYSDIVLNQEGLPHNPMINSGAIIVCSLLHTLVIDEEKEERMSLAAKFDMLRKHLNDLGEARVGFSNSVYQSSKQLSARNYALAYHLNERRGGRNCFPPNANFEECVDLYFMSCAIESTCDDMAVMAATLAKGGVCPVTNDKIVSPDSVRDMLTLMYSCGMYDYSGEFAFEVGTPCKSGVAGTVIIVIPNKMGICCHSPRLDQLKNSVRGIQFAKHLNKKFHFHGYDMQRHCDATSDPTIRRAISPVVQHASLMYAAFRGDIGEIRHQWRCGVDVSKGDYQGRTPLHVAATAGRLQCVEYLLTTCQVPSDPEDLWGRTPVDEADRFGHTEVAEYIKASK